jgi:hypothetical protein
MESNTNRRPPIVSTERYILKVRNVEKQEMRVRELDLSPEDLESLQVNLKRNINGFVLEALIRKVGNE